MIKVIGHTSFLGNTGYNSHSKNFFTRLNNHFPTRIRNYTYTPEFSKLELDSLHMLIKQKWADPPYSIGKPFFGKASDTTVNIVLNDTLHHYFFDSYGSPSIAYNVWESTRQPENFFNALLKYDQFWCPTNWQKECMIEQGYPSDRIRVIHEGVDTSIFIPNDNTSDSSSLFETYNIPADSFVFMIFGKWEHRKSTLEMISCWKDTFSNIDNCYLVLSVDNSFSTDGLTSTVDRLSHHGLTHSRIRVLDFVPAAEYVKWLQYGSCLLSCSRSEGWNLPLIECMSCGTPTIYSDIGSHREFAVTPDLAVSISGQKEPKGLYNFPNTKSIGLWPEPDFDDFKNKMLRVYNNYKEIKDRCKESSISLRDEFTWEKSVLSAVNSIEELVQNKEKTKSPIRVECNVEVVDNGIKASLNFGQYLDTVLIRIQDVITGNYYEDWFNDVVPGIIYWVTFNTKTYSVEVDVFTKTYQHIFSNKFELDYTTDTHQSRFIDDNDFNVMPDLYNLTESTPEFSCNFLSGPEFKCHNVDPKLLDEVHFINKFSGHILQKSILVQDGVVKNDTKYFTDWSIKVKRENNIVFSQDLDLKGKNVFISLESKSLGDTIAWIPYVKVFKDKHKCNLWVSTFWNYLFEDVEYYDHIQFVKPGTSVSNLYAVYNVGCFDNDLYKNKNNWRVAPLQKVCSDFLGLDYEEIRTPIDFSPGPCVIKEKYVTLSEHSTLQCKYWNNNGGWQRLIDYLNEQGYKVAVVSKEDTSLNNVINLTNKSIRETMNNIYYSEFLISVSSGLSWLAWALQKHVVMISGFSLPNTEFKSNISRIINTAVCHGCLNDPIHDFDRGDWYWCPTYKGTPHQFECSKNITSEMVIPFIDNLIRKY